VAVSFTLLVGEERSQLRKQLSRCSLREEIEKVTASDIGYIIRLNCHTCGIAFERFRLYGYVFVSLRNSYVFIALRNFYVCIGKYTNPRRYEDGVR